MVPEKRRGGDTVGKMSVAHMTLRLEVRDIARLTTLVKLAWNKIQPGTWYQRDGNRDFHGTRTTPPWIYFGDRAYVTLTFAIPLEARADAFPDLFTVSDKSS